MLGAAGAGTTVHGRDDALGGKSPRLAKGTARAVGDAWPVHAQASGAARQRRRHKGASQGVVCIPKRGGAHRLLFARQHRAWRTRGHPGSWRAYRSAAPAPATSWRRRTSSTAATPAACSRVHASRAAATSCCCCCSHAARSIRWLCHGQGARVWHHMSRVDKRCTLIVLSVRGGGLGATACPNGAVDAPAGP